MLGLNTFNIIMNMFWFKSNTLCWAFYLSDRTNILFYLLSFFGLIKYFYLFPFFFFPSTRFEAMSSVSILVLIFLENSTCIFHISKSKVNQHLHPQTRTLEYLTSFYSLWIYILPLFCILILFKTSYYHY